MHSSLLAGLVTVATSASPADWRTALVPDVVAAHVAGWSGGVLVVGLGPPSEDLKALTAALRSAIERSATFDFVLDASRLGDVSQLENAALLQKAARLPVQLVAIARIVPGVRDIDGLITLVSKEGGAVREIIATPGVPIPRPRSDAAGPAVPARPKRPEVPEIRHLGGVRIGVGVTGGAMLLAGMALILHGAVIVEFKGIFERAPEPLTSTGWFSAGLTLLILGTAGVAAAVFLPNAIEVEPGPPIVPRVRLSPDIAPRPGGALGVVVGRF